MNMGQNPRALWWWLSDLVSLSSVETHIPYGPLSPAFVYKEQGKKAGLY